MCSGLMHSTIDELSTVFLQNSKTLNSPLHSNMSANCAFSSIGTKMWFQIDIYGSKFTRKKKVFAHFLRYR